ncbi:MAG TPA: M28 family peptidase [Actinoplanes sp.]|nr:M28 family peptidase [Actinoplanes sp.]
MSPMRAAADRALTRPPARGAAALVALVALTATGAAALWAIRPPAARGADVPPGEFSAARAFQQVQVIGAEPHVTGGAANDRVREHLLGTLRGLGLSPEVQDTVSEQGGALSAGSGGIGLARVRNVIARIPGTGSTGRVFLVAHYDSVQNGPGANDDGAGTSTILETVRALTSGPRLRNDVVVVLTDAEEACLCGAQAFVKQHRLARDGGVVLNIEARGSTGPVVTFESSGDDARLIDVYARVPKPVGTSFAVQVYRLLPSDTDFSAFRDAGFRGLNSAYIDGAARYHAPTDVPSSMDRNSLQHHGDNTLALTRAFGDTDLGALEARTDATYFPVPGGLARYPGWLVWPIGALALVAVLILGLIAKRRGLVSSGRLISGPILALVPIVLAPLAAQGFWALMVLIRPAYAGMTYDPYRPLWYRLAVLALTAAIVFGWYALLRRRLSPAALAFAGLFWLAVLGLVLAWYAPGGSYLAALPALAGALAGIIAVLLRGGWGSVVAVLLGGAVAVLVLLPTAILFFPAMGLVLAGAGAFIAVLLGMALLPVIDLLHPAAGGQRGLDALRATRLGGLPTLVAMLAAIAFAAAGLTVDRFDAAHPAPTQLMYALDTDSNSARWMTLESEPQRWTAQYVDGSPGEVTAALPAFAGQQLITGPATAAALPAPQLTVVSDTRTGGTRALRLRLVPQRPVRMATLHVAADAGVTAAAVAGRSVPVDGAAGGGWGFGFTFHGPPPEGIEIALTVRARGPIRFRAMDGSDGLGALPGFLPRPPEVGIRGDHLSEMVAVARTYTV